MESLIRIIYNLIKEKSLDRAELIQILIEEHGINENVCNNLVSTLTTYMMLQKDFKGNLTVNPELINGLGNG